MTQPPFIFDAFAGHPFEGIRLCTLTKRRPVSSNSCKSSESPGRLNCSLPHTPFGGNEDDQGNIIYQVCMMLANGGRLSIPERNLT